VPSFGLLISTAYGFGVRRSGCSAVATPVRWNNVFSDTSIPLEEGALRMLGPDAALVAGTQRGASGHILSVWRYYP
jgi:hypothetical protein